MSVQDKDVNLSELASIIVAMIREEPQSFGFSMQEADGITVDGVEEELRNYMAHKRDFLISKLFDKVFRSLIERGLVKRRDGGKFTIQDYEEAGKETTK